MKSSVEEIRQRFDHDVERFSNVETGQSATVDAPLVLELLTEAAATINPKAKSVLDIGCGAGNYSLKLLERLPGLDVTLLDLSRPMVDRACERVSQATTGQVIAVQGDIRHVPLDEGMFDIIMAGAVLHHLREESEWESVFAKLYRALTPGGSFWIADLIEHSIPAVQNLMWERWGAYLAELGGREYRERVRGYTQKEDTPRPLLFQLELLQKAGFRAVEILHKNSCFAAFGGVK